MCAHADTVPGAPAFPDWVGSRGHGLLRFGYLTCGDLPTADAVVEHVLETLRPQWTELSDAVDLEIFVRQEILRALASRRRHRAAPSAAESAPSGEVELLEQVWGACHSMPLEQRAALVLRCSEGMDVVDIAEALGRDPDAARDLVSGGLARISDLGAVRGRRLSAESVLHDVFAAYAARVPATADLARRVAWSARRRRRWYGLAGVLAVGVLIPLGWVASPPQEHPVQPGSDAPWAVVPDMRWESYGGIEVQVPASWTHGNLTQWCAPEGSPGHVDGPAVDRPGWRSRYVCTASSGTGNRGVQRPTYTAGLLLRPAGSGPRIGRADIASGAAVYRRRVGAVDLTVIDVEDTLARRILGSAAVIVGTDANGCEPHPKVPTMGHLLHVNSPGLAGVNTTLFQATGDASMSVCEYERQPWGRPTLVDSERRGPGEALAAAEAMRQGQPTDDRAPARLKASCVESAATLVRFWAGPDSTDVWLHYTGCGPHGIDDGVRPRRLTSEVQTMVLGHPVPGQ